MIKYNCILQRHQMNLVSYIYYSSGWSNISKSEWCVSCTPSGNNIKSSQLIQVAPTDKNKHPLSGQVRWNRYSGQNLAKSVTKLGGYNGKLVVCEAPLMTKCSTIFTVKEWAVVCEDFSWYSLDDQDLFRQVVVLNDRESTGMMKGNFESSCWSAVYHGCSSEKNQCLFCRGHHGVLSGL